MKCMERMIFYFILAHEIRHCAQYQATKGIGLADIATPETIYEWKTEFSRYNPGCKDESCQEVELLPAISHKFLAFLCRMYARI